MSSSTVSTSFFLSTELRWSFWIRTNAVSVLWCCRYALWKMSNKSLLSRCWRSCTATWRSSNFDIRKNRDADGAADSSDDNQPDPSGWQADAAENTPDTEAENDSGSSVLLSSDDELTPQSHAKNKKTLEMVLFCSREYVPGCLPYRTVPYRTVPYRTVPYRTVPYRTVPYRTVPYRTVPYRTVPYRTVPYRTVPYRTVPYRTVPYRTVCCINVKGTLLYGTGTVPN